MEVVVIHCTASLNQRVWNMSTNCKRAGGYRTNDKGANYIDDKGAGRYSIVIRRLIGGGGGVQRK